MNYILHTNSLTKKYKNFQALNGLTMNVLKGSIYGFVGKNGAGKTTLIRLICGLQEPTSGDFTLYGICNNSKDITKSRRRMGAVVETPSIYMDMTAEENLKDYKQYLMAEFRIFGFIPKASAARVFAEYLLLSLLNEFEVDDRIDFDVFGNDMNQAFMLMPDDYKDLRRIFPWGRLID